MARCDCCDLDLDEIERYCPGCGAPRPRTKVVDVSTTLRERFHAASGDVEAEYAFGGTRTVRTASPKTKAAEAPTVDLPAANAEAPKKSEPAAEPPAVEARVPSRGRVPEPKPGDIEAALELDAEPVPEPAIVLDVEPDEPESLPEPEREREPEPVVAVVEPEPESIPEPLVAEAPPVVAQEPAPVVIDEEHVNGGTPQQVEDPGSQAVAAGAELTEFKPYVVLPPPRQMVAAKVLSPVAPDDTDERADAPKRRGGMFVVLLALLAIVGGAAFFLTGREPVTNGTPLTAEASDGSISLDGPAGWRIESREAGVVGIGEPSHDLHVHATAIRRSALKDGLSLKRRAEDVQEEFLASLEGAEASDVGATKIGPYAAVRQTLSTDSVVYVHTVVKMPKYFVNVLAWTPAERFDEEQTQLLGVVGTVRSSN